mmetsp:Transcript_62078/g.192705  ORF Transcript_62078/g.192705 Transcript_62078/m.192705 type:complete len:269 (-) Transcript_62078:349-1155(-)
MLALSSQRRSRSCPSSATPWHILWPSRSGLRWERWLLSLRRAATRRTRLASRRARHAHRAALTAAPSARAAAGGTPRPQRHRQAPLRRQRRRPRQRGGRVMTRPAWSNGTLACRPRSSAWPPSPASRSQPPGTPRRVPSTGSSARQTAASRSTLRSWPHRQSDMTRWPPTCTRSHCSRPTSSQWKSAASCTRPSGTLWAASGTHGAAPWTSSRRRHPRATRSRRSTHGSTARVGSRSSQRSATISSTSWTATLLPRPPRTNPEPSTFK